MNDAAAVDPDPGNAALLVEKLAMDLSVPPWSPAANFSTWPPFYHLRRADRPMGGSLPRAAAHAAHGVTLRRFNGDPSGRAQGLRHGQARGAQRREEAAEHTDGACPDDTLVNISVG